MKVRITKKTQPPKTGKGRPELYPILDLKVGGSGLSITPESKSPKALIALQRKLSAICVHRGNGVKPKRVFTVRMDRKNNCVGIWRIE